MELVKQTQAANAEPIDGDGEEPAEWTEHICESCSAEKFYLKEWYTFRVAVCAKCGQPQESVAWAEATATTK